MATNQGSKGSTHDQASETSKKGSTTGGAGNFKNNPARASEAGKKGGEHSHGGGHKS